MHRHLILIFGWWFFLSISNICAADSLESIFSPGELSAAHKNFDERCDSCHDTSDKTKQDKLCLDCHEHKNVANDIRQHKGFHGRIKMPGQNACKQCHREHRGRGENIIALTTGSFDHGNTDFKLKGEHLVLDCKTCHKQNTKYREAPSACYSCHKKQDIHKGNLGKECQTCHVETGWKKSGFDHEKNTDFPLKGKHSEIDCQLCHINNEFKETPKSCFNCHNLNDVHGRRYGTKCQTCHTENEWKKTKFDHARDANYSLTGKHRTTDCDSCHTGDLYTQKVSKTCFSCHRNDDEHKGKNGGKCHECHTTQGWGSSQFDHNRKTDFPLTGKHKSVICESCHRGTVDKKLPKDCYSCHKYSDPHTGKMGKNCNQCHNTHGWNKNLFFDHDISRFPLIGIHAVTACEECHITQDYKGTYTQCIKCHESRDEHKGRFGEDCGYCHNPNSWKTWLFDHNKQTKFKLDGTHADNKCYSCHRTKMKTLKRSIANCSNCHSGDDIHQGGFGQYCDRCHTTRDFRELNMTGIR
jgi:hypothetical protein